jgi:Ca2+-binding RTX toxin-like protein
MKRFLATGVAITAAILLSGGTANAAVSCSYDGTHAVGVLMTGIDDSAFIRVGFGGAIQVNNVACGTATVDNTNEIVVTGSSGAQGFTIDESGGHFVHSSGPGELELKFSVKLSTGTDSVIVFGGAGDDVVRIGSGGINLDGDSDVDVTFGSVDNVSIADFFGGTNTFTANGGSGTGNAWLNPTSITGGSGNDTITGGDGGDSLNGLGGNDTINGRTGTDFIHGGDENDVIDGGEDSDSIVPDSGNDTVDGGPGADSFFASDFPDGNDSISGGDDNDSASYSIRGSAGVVVSINGVANDGRAGIETDNVMLDVESLTGSQGPDTLTGSAASNFLDGGSGSDTLNGGAGQDTLFGGFADAGVDTLNGDAGNDNLSGGSGADQLNGDDGDDTLDGGPHNDTEKGGRGQDQFVQTGSAINGADVMQGGDGQDNASYFARTGNLTITLDNNANDGLAGENDNVKADIERAFGGTGNDSITGSALANQLSGSGGNDTIKGLEGPDFLAGGDGDDTITGGEGGDSLVGDAGADNFHAQDNGTDSIFGGNDLDTDTVLDSDPSDTLFAIP